MSDAIPDCDFFSTGAVTCRPPLALLEGVDVLSVPLIKGSYDK